MLKHINSVPNYLSPYKVVSNNQKQKRRIAMYLGQLLAYPIWLYIGLSVIAIVRNAWKNMEE